MLSILTGLLFRPHLVGSELYQLYQTCFFLFSQFWTVDIFIVKNRRVISLKGSSSVEVGIKKMFSDFLFEELLRFIFFVKISYLGLILFTFGLISEFYNLCIKRFIENCLWVIKYGLIWCSWKTSSLKNSNSVELSWRTVCFFQFFSMFAFLVIRWQFTNPIEVPLMINTFYDQKWSNKLNFCVSPAFNAFL